MVQKVDSAVDEGIRGTARVALGKVGELPEAFR
jgi:hypothetical protein